MGSPSAGGSAGGVFDYNPKGENFFKSVGCRQSWFRDKLGPPVSFCWRGVFDFVTSNAILSLSANHWLFLPVITDK